MADPAQSRFVRACRCEPVDAVPAWFMRQAGRSLPEYRAVRGEGSILDAIKQPELAAEITLQPVRRYGVDAAILYSDIVVPPHAVGFGIDVEPGVGPVAAAPFATVDDLDRLPELEPRHHVPWVIETVERAVAALDGVPLIGFAGAPFTVASYLVEGRPSRVHARTKRLMYDEPELWHRLADRLAHLSLAFMRAQVEAGASAVQLFDSWAGALSPSDYETYALPHSRTVLEGLADSGVPRIHFGVGTGELLELMASAGTDVVGIDWRVPLDVARRRIGPRFAVQGNLDPAACYASWPAVETKVRDVLARAGTEPGHVFNLGHGVLPDLDPSVLEKVVDLVHAEGKAGVR